MGDDEHVLGARIEPTVEWVAQSHVSIIVDVWDVWVRGRQHVMDVYAEVFEDVVPHFLIDRIIVTVVGFNGIVRFDGIGIIIKPFFIDLLFN